MHATAWGYGLATVTDDGRPLDTWFPAPALGNPPDGAAPDADLTALAGTSESAAARRVHTEVVRVEIDLTAAPSTAPDAYLRLHLLSHRLVRPREVNIDGVFARAAQRRVDELRPVRRRGLRGGPRPAPAPRARAGVGVSTSSRAWSTTCCRTAFASPTPTGCGSGAHLARGTTVMHEGFVNYNAGTLGTSMVEGRISAGVVVDDGSDVGGGASIMGTLSGGGREQITVGKRCLVGANAGIGISLGDDCIVEAGTYVTAGAKVLLPDGTTVKAAQLSGRPGLLFLRNSLTGALEARPRQGTGATLNDVLHANA